MDKVISRLFPTSSILWFFFLFLIHDFDNFTGHFSEITPFCRVIISIFSSHAAFPPRSAVPLMRVVVGAPRNQGICLEIFRKVGAKGPNLQSVTSPSQTSTATAMPVPVVFPGKCLVYQAPQWQQRMKALGAALCSQMQPLDCKSQWRKDVSGFCQGAVVQAALLRWAQLNHKQASWCSNGIVSTTGKNTLYPPMLQATGQVSVHDMTFFYYFFSQCPGIRFGQAAMHKNQNIFS